MDEIYLKFRRRRKDDAFWDEFALGESLNELGRRPRGDAASRREDQEPGKKESEFLIVSKRLQRDLFSFLEFIPRIAGMTPILQQVEIQSAIYEPVREKGTLIKKRGLFEIYSYPTSELDPISKKIKAIQSFGQARRNLPHMLLIWLVAVYDSFLMQMLRAMFLSRPELLKSGQRQISYDKLLEFQDFDDATEFVIEKETEGILRESHAEQVRKISGYLGDTPLTKDLTIWPHFIELCERRNLLVHTDGIVSTQYLEVCRKYGYDVSNIKKGDRLKVGWTYLRRAAFIIFEMSAKLLQVTWRKLDPKSVDEADGAFIALQYESIRRQQMKLACAVSDFGLKHIKKWASEGNRLMVVVNAANAFKKNDQLNRSAEVLESVDWGATGEQYRVCVAAVRDDVEEVISLMRRMGRGHPEIRATAYREWPVFDGIRTNEAFRDAFEEVFGERMLAEALSKPTKSGAEQKVPELRVIEGSKQSMNPMDDE